MKTQLKFISNIILLSMMFCMTVHGKSLWLSPNTNERGMFADRVACRVGDILTIELNETTVQNNKLKTESTKSATILGQVTNWLFANSGFGKHNGSLPNPNISLSNDDYKSDSKIENGSTLQATGSAVVIDVLPNGNLVIEGKREVYFSGERQTMVLRGIVRPNDISTNNTVNGKMIADAQLEIINEGAISASQQKGWLWKFKDWISPF